MLMKIKKCSVICMCLVLNQLFLCIGAIWHNCKTPTRTVTSALFNNETTMVETKVVVLRSCQITSIDRAAFRDMRKLTHLSLKNNTITDLDVTTFQYVLHLQHVDLSENKIHELRNGIFAKLASVHTVYLQKNLISYIEAGVFKDMASLRKLSLANNKISTLGADTFVNNKHLQYLILSSNYIRNVDKNLFKQLNLLNYLILSSNQVSKISRELFSTMINLRHLSLSYNSIQELEAGCFSNNRQLELVSLKNNKIFRLDNKLFTNLTKLKTVYLQNNLISHISERTFLNSGDLGNNNPEIKFKIYLSNNLLQCDCQLVPLYYMWANSKKYIFDDPRCATPPKLHNMSWSNLAPEDFCATKIALNELISVYRGKNVLFTCDMRAEAVEWRYMNNTIHEYSASASGQRYIVLSEKQNETSIRSTLIIENVGVEDGGKYTCYLNISEQRTFTLTVLVSDAWKSVATVLIIFIISMAILRISVLTVKMYYKKGRKTDGGIEMYQKPLNDSIYEETNDVADAEGCLKPIRTYQVL